MHACSLFRSPSEASIAHLLLWKRFKTGEDVDKTNIAALVEKKNAALRSLMTCGKVVKAAIPDDEE